MPRDIIVDGDGRAEIGTHGNGAVSTPSPVRKSGRPRKAIAGVQTNGTMPTGAPHSQIPPAAGGGGHNVLEIQGINGSPNPSSASKRGRPRKAGPPLEPVADVPTGAPIAETPQETAAGGGHPWCDIQMRIASPYSNETGSDAVADDAGHFHCDTQGRFARPSAPQTPPSVAVGGGHIADDDQHPLASPTTDTTANVLDAGGGGEVRARDGLLPNASVPDLALIVEDLITLQKDRTFLIKSKNRQNNATVAYVRRRLKWDPSAPEAERKKINARAISIVDKVEKGRPLSDEDRDIGVKCADIILTAAKAREPIDLALKGVKKADSEDGQKKLGVEQLMEKRAKELPVWSWVQDVKGFGALGLAIIIGEAGDLSNYANPGKLWKRMGLAPYGREPGTEKAAKTWRSQGGLSVTEWTWFGYNPARRSEMWNRAEPILKSQIRRVLDADGKDTGERQVLGVYGKVYLDRKKYELDRDPEMSKMWAHNRAQRYMEKRLLKHLWQKWRSQPLED